MRHGARNIGISNERRRERVPSGRTSEDTYEMSDDDYEEDRSPSTSRTHEYAL